ERAIASPVERRQEIVAVLEREDGIVQPDARDRRDGAQDEVFDGRLGGPGHGDAVAITAEAGIDPETVDIWRRHARDSRRIVRTHSYALSYSSSASSRRARRLQGAPG